MTAPSPALKAARELYSRFWVQRGSHKLASEAILGKLDNDVVMQIALAAYEAGKAESPWTPIADIPEEWKDGRRLILDTPWGVVFGCWLESEPASDCARAMIYSGWESEGGETWRPHNMGDNGDEPQHGMPTYVRLPPEPPTKG